MSFFFFLKVSILMSFLDYPEEFYAQNYVVLCNCGNGSPQNFVGFPSLIKFDYFCSILISFLD